MEKILIDSDVLIDFLRGHHERIRETFTAIQSKRLSGMVSIVSVIELYSGEDSANEKKRAVLEKLLSFLDVCPITDHCARRAGTIRRNYQLSLADAIIAASAMEEKIPLYTLNTKHFRGIGGLHLFTVTGK